MTMNGMIYKIEINENDIYVGSTSKKLCRRQSQHNYYLKNPNSNNYDKKRYPHRKLYKKCIENNIDYIKCIWVADCEYNSIEELRMIEEKYRKELNGNLNMKKCYISKEDKKENFKQYCKEYYEENKSKIDEHQKKYYEENKSKINEKQKNKIKCEKCDSIVRKSDITRHQRTKKCLLLSECIFSDDD